MQELRAKREKLQKLLDDPGLYARDPAKFAEATKVFAKLETECSTAEESWLKLEIKREEPSPPESETRHEEMDGPEIKEKQRRPRCRHFSRPRRRLFCVRRFRAELPLEREPFARRRTKYGKE
jgi:hypothetical protein